MIIMNIILILLYCLGLSFQTIKSGLFCDDTLKDIYVYDQKLGSYRKLKYEQDRAGSFNVDYIDLDVDPGAFIKFTCYNIVGPTLGGGCFLINNNCHCYDFDINRKTINKDFAPLLFTVKFKNGKECKFNATYLQQDEFTDLVYYHNVPLDVDEITCLNQTITAPINIQLSLNFSEYIKSSFNVTNLNIGIITNYSYFTFNNLPISEYDQFNIINDDLKYFSNQTSKINVLFKNYGVVLDKNKTCQLNIRFCYNSCLECNDTDPNETSHQCLKCKENFYFIENTTNCMTKDQMNNSNYSHYFFDYSKKIFRQCLNECSTCNNEAYCTNCTEGYHFIYNEAGKCISKPNEGDLLYLDEKNNTYIKCPEGTEIVKNNTCIRKEPEQTNSNNSIIIIVLTIVILIIIIVLFFFIKRYASRKDCKSEIPNILEKNSADNQLLNNF